MLSPVTYARVTSSLRAKCAKRSWSPSSLTGRLGDSSGVSVGASLGAIVGAKVGFVMVSATRSRLPAAPSADGRRGGCTLARSVVGSPGTRTTKSYQSLAAGLAFDRGPLPDPDES